MSFTLAIYRYRCNHSHVLLFEHFTATNLKYKTDVIRIGIVVQSLQDKTLNTMGENWWTIPSNNISERTTIKIESLQE